MVVYLDNAATSPLAPEVIDLINQGNRDLYANPSSIHSLGLQAKARLKQAREAFAASINASPEEIIFTSGATESNNTVFGILDYDLIITSPSEHPSVIEPAKASGKPIIWLSLDQEGFVDLEELHQYLKQNRNYKILVSIMHGNNEIGTIQDLQVIAEVCANFDNVVFHCDCVQTFTKHELDAEKFQFDLASFSAHKIHGPKGVGALFVRKSLQGTPWFRKEAFILGGAQEQGLRSGTENLVGIMAFICAVELTQNKEAQDHIWQLTQKLYQDLKKLPGFVLNGPKDFGKRVLGSLNFSFVTSRLTSEELVLQLDLAGLCVSSGSACSSNKISGDVELLSSYVLRACKVQDEIAARALRISLSRFNSEEECKNALKIIEKTLARFPVKSRA